MNEEVSMYIRSRCSEIGECLRMNSKAKTRHHRRHPLIRLPGVEQQVLARRALYEAERGPIRGSQVLTPTCGDECCIQPEHQKQISQREKRRLGAEAGGKSPTRAAKVRAARQVQARNKLNLELAREIRASDETNVAWAARLNVNPATISDVRKHKTWRDVRDPFAGLMAANDSTRRAA